MAIRLKASKPFELNIVKPVLKEYNSGFTVLTNFELNVSLCWSTKSFRSVTSDSKSVILSLCSTFGKLGKDGKLEKLGSDHPPFS